MRLQAIGILCLTAIVLTLIPAYGRSTSSGGFTMHCDKDRDKIKSILDSLCASDADAGKRVVAAARGFIGTPYKSSPLDSMPDTFVIDACGLDCVTLVETSLALASASMKRNALWTDFPAALENLRYRGGNCNGYASRLHYFCDWISDNVYRDNITEITPMLDHEYFQTKTLDYMTKHSGQYPALKDSAALEKIRDLEAGFCNYKIPYVKKECLTKKNVRSMLASGDIMVFLTKESGLDCSHVGIIEMRGNDIYLLHASASKEKVTAEEKPLQAMLRNEYRNCPGIRILRIRTD